MNLIINYPKRISRKYYKPITLSRFTVCAVFTYSAFILFFASVYLFFIHDYMAANRWQSTLLIREQPVGEFAILEAIYFSAITTFTIGYGDITPLGWCKWVAVIEGFCGYLAPTLCVAVGLSILLNHQYDHMRRIRRKQKILLKLISQGWRLQAIWPEPAAHRVILSLQHRDGSWRKIEMEHACLDFSRWQNGYLNSWEEQSLQKVEAWLRMLKK